MSQKLAKINESTSIVEAVFVVNDDLTQEAVDTSERRVPGFDYIIETETTRTSSKGYLWHPERGYFTEPALYASWTLDENGEWQAPVAKPATGEYDWNEDLQVWEPVIVQIDVNTADEATLQGLDGVGPATASAIVLERSVNGLFTSLLNLSVRVDGVSATMADGWTNAYVGEVV